MAGLINMGQPNMHPTRHQPSSADWLATVLRVLIYVGLIALATAMLFTDIWVVWLALVCLGLLLLVNWHAHRFAYGCTRCGNVFTISALTDLLTPQGVGRDPQGRLRGWKLLRCPGCGRWQRASVVRKEINA
jgi:hypothetical protein